MDYLKKIGYLKGLAAGLELGRETPEQKVLHAIIDALDELGDEFRSAQEVLEGVELDVAHLSEDLDRVTGEIGDIEDGITEFGRMFADTVRDGADEDSEPLKLFPNRFQDDDDEEEDEADEYHVTCPVCEMDFVLSEEDLSKESVACPGCGKTLEFDIQRPPNS